MKKAILIVIAGLFLASCGSGNSDLEIKPDTVTGTTGTVDTLQPILDSAAQALDSIQDGTDPLHRTPKYKIAD